METVCRCGWCNLRNPLYVQYHDEEWGMPQRDDQKLFELLVLESFHPERGAAYGEEAGTALLGDKSIVRNRRKIAAAIANAGIFLEIQAEWGSFARYIWHFTDGQVVYETGKASSPLSDQVSADLKKRGMTFVGTTVVYAYLQAAGVIDSHEPGCFLHRKE